MNKPLVFLSHASADKGRIKPLALALIKEGMTETVGRKGFRLFIDKPHELAFGGDFLDEKGIQFIQIGEHWDDEIRAALDKSSVVVGCLSSNFLATSRVLDLELSHGFVNNNLATCIVDGKAPEDLTAPPKHLVDFKRLQSVQIPMKNRPSKEFVAQDEVEALIKDPAFQALVNRIRSLLDSSAEIAEDQTASLSLDPSWDEIEPLLHQAGRTQGNGPFEDAKDKIVHTERTSPLIVFGPNSELVYEFAKTLPSYLKRTGTAHSFFESYPPTCPVTEADTGPLKEGILRQLVVRLDLPPDYEKTPAKSDIPGMFDFVADAIRAKYPAGQPILLPCQPLNLEVHGAKECLYTVQAWVELWEKIGEKVQGYTLVPILPVGLVGAEPGWQHTPLKYPPVPSSLFKRALGWLPGSEPCINTHCFEQYIKDGLDWRGSHIGLLAPIEKIPTLLWLDETKRHVKQFGPLKHTVSSKFPSGGDEKNGITMATFVRAAEQVIIASERNAA